MLGGVLIYQDPVEFRDVLGNSWVVDDRKYIFPIFIQVWMSPYIVCSLICMNFSISK